MPLLKHQSGIVRSIILDQLQQPLIVAAAHDSANVVDVPREDRPEGQSRLLCGKRSAASCKRPSLYVFGKRQHYSAALVMRREPQCGLRHMVWSKPVANDRTGPQPGK